MADWPPFNWHPPSRRKLGSRISGALWTPACAEGTVCAVVGLASGRASGDGQTSFSIVAQPFRAAKEEFPAKGKSSGFSMNCMDFSGPGPAGLKPRGYKQRVNDSPICDETEFSDKL
jgi:hypothetical protein